MKIIPLTQGKVAIVDDDVYEWASKFKWRAQKGWSTCYAKRWSPSILGKRHIIWLHREILQPSSGMEIDHIDRNGLNNRRSNLRIVTDQQNNLNRGHKASKFRGVHKDRNKWQARIAAFGKCFYLGVFANEIDAARAYDAAAIIHHGEFAQPNFP